MNNLRSSLGLLVVFEAVAAEKSVSRAAERLAMSQPAVSHALNRLRDQFADRLFVRTGKGLELTPRALTLLLPVRQLLQDAARLLVPPQFDPLTSQKVFRIGTSDYANAILVPQLIKACCNVAPGVSLDLLHVGHKALDDLASGKLDCVFWGGEKPSLPWHAQSLFTEHLRGVICASHPLANKLQSGGRVTLKDYLHYSHIIVSLRNPGANPVETALLTRGQKRHVQIVTQSFSANLTALKGTELIASLPSRFGPAAERVGCMSFALPLKLEPYPYYLLWHARTDGDAACQWLRNLIRQQTAA